jgi:hypothetical protein
MVYPDLPELAAVRRKKLVCVSQQCAVFVVRHAISRLTHIRDAKGGIEILPRHANHGG